MHYVLPGRDARLWQQKLSTAARLDQQDSVFFTQDSVMRVKLERQLGELMTLIDNTEADPLYLSVGFQVLTALVLEAAVPLDEAARARLLTGCDCREFIAYLRRDLAHRVDQAGATAAELAQDACEAQLAQAIIERYEAETAQRQALLERLHGYASRSR